MVKKSDVINGIRLVNPGMGVPEACRLYTILTDESKKGYARIFDGYKGANIPNIKGR